MGFNRDITESVKPSKRAEIDHDVNGHWGNIVQNVFANIERAGTELASGTLQVLKDAGESINPLSAMAKYANIEKPKDATDNLIAGLNGNQKRMEAIIQNNPLPNTFLGNAVQSVASFAPDIIGTAALPEAKLAEGAGLLAKTGKAVLGNFTKYMAAKGAIVGYGKAREEGRTVPQSLLESAKESGKGALTGVERVLS